MTALNLTLAVNDPDVSVQFYRDILNLRVELSDQSDFLSSLFTTSRFSFSDWLSWNSNIRLFCNILVVPL